jgi:hypothetical protein
MVLKKMLGLAVVVFLFGGCSKKEEHPTLDEIFGDGRLLDSALSHPSQRAERTGPPPPAPPPLPETAPIGFSDIQVLQGPLEVAIVHKELRRRQESLRRCYAFSLREHPEGQGKVGILITFNERGRVTEALISENRVGEYLSGCLLSALRRFRFPGKPISKGQVQVQLEFSLKEVGNE